MKRSFIGMGLLIGLGLVALIGVAALTTFHRANAAAGNSPSDMGLAKVVIGVEGMSCGGCIATINSALSKFEGIADINVDIAGGKAEVIYQADKISNVQQFADTITASGYPAKVTRLISSQDLQKEQLKAQSRSATAIASVGDVEVSRADFEAELAHARGRYEMIYGSAVFSDQRGRKLLNNLKVQITQRLITEAIQLHEINRANFSIDKATVERRYEQYLDKQGLTQSAFEAELAKNGYSADYFMKKFRNRVRVESYVDTKVLDGINNEIEKQKRYSEWFANAQLLVEVAYYDKDIERQLQASRGSASGCGNSCSVSQ